MNTENTQVTVKEPVFAALQKQNDTLVQIAGINIADKARAEAIVKQEVSYIYEAAMVNPEIKKCDPTSVVLALRRAIKNNLTLDPQAGLMYIKTRNINISPKDQPAQWVTIMETQETVNGVLSKLRMMGLVIDWENPVPKFDPNGKCIGVTFKWQHGNGRWETREFFEYDFERWGNASHKERSRGKQDAASVDYRNQLYKSWKGGIDPEFAKAKAIRHALKKLGANPNERMASAIQPTPMKVIAHETAMSEASENLEQNPTVTNDAAATYHVQVHEVVTVDNTPLVETEEMPFPNE